MAQRNKVTLLKVVLIIFAIMAIVYGVGFFIVPGIWVNLSGGNPVVFGWLRWPGGVIIALGIGALMVVRKPEKQGIFVFTSALGTLLAGLGLLYCWVMNEYSGSTMFIAVPTVINLVLSGFLWWGRGRAKGII
ncbi:MAG: hypothetical protein AMS17_19585 [Spirochaetes bacterium DG_61]|nr:MAG: hypothetical protein AMS17_19585 [Spirochaetes bacterium DG_61]